MKKEMEIKVLSKRLKELSAITDGPESDEETPEIREEKELIAERLQQLS